MNYEKNIGDETFSYTNESNSIIWLVAYSVGTGPFLPCKPAELERPSKLAHSRTTFAYP